MSTDLITDFKCLAGIYEEQPDSTFALVTRLADLTEIFHPLQDGSTKATSTGFLVKLSDGTIKDLNEVFEPLSSGKQCELATNFEVDGTDLRDIFAGLNTVEVKLELSQLPAGVFDCTTRVKIHYDRSGSMDTAFGYITPAVNVLKDWFSKTFNFGQAGYGSIVVEDGANPWEETLTWISEDAGAAPSQTEVHIAYINESMSGGTGSAGGYVDKWIAAQQAGGHRYAAIMGAAPLYGGYDAVILGDITRDQKNGRPLSDMGVSAFFDIQQTSPSSFHMETIANWLNIPMKPEDLTITVSAHESDQYDDRVRWDVRSGICGLTQKADGDSILQSQSSWKHEVYVGDSQDLIHTENFTSFQTRYTYMADDHKVETDFYLKVTAVGDNGEADKSSSFVLCNKQAISARPRPADKFELGGEGGYCWDSYVFQAKDKVFTRTKPWTFTAEPDRHSIYTDCKDNEWWVNHGVIRSADGNTNQCCLYTDGTVNFKGTTTEDTWIRDNVSNMKDTFLPSSYGTAGYQYILLDNGDLIAYVASSAGSVAAVTTIMTDVFEIIAVNQAHNEDIIVTTNSDEVYHVAPGVYAPVAPYATKIKDLLASDVLTATVGDLNDICTVIKNSEPTVVYRIKTKGGEGRHNGLHQPLNSVDTCSHPNLNWVTQLMSTGETFVDAVAQEFHLVLITTERIYTYKPTSGADSAAIGEGTMSRAWYFDLPSGADSVKCLGATAYTAAIDIDGTPYLLSHSGYKGLDGYNQTGQACTADAYHPLTKCQPMCDYHNLIGEITRLDGTTGLQAIESTETGSNLNICDVNYICAADLTRTEYKDGVVEPKPFYPNNDEYCD